MYLTSFKIRMSSVFIVYIEMRLGICYNLVS